MAEVVRYVNPGADASGDGTTSALTSGDNTHAYQSLSAWEAGEQTNLISATDTHVVKCAGTTADTTNMSIAGWATNSSYYITIEADEAQSDGRYDGPDAYSASYYVLAPTAGGNSIQVQQANTVVRGIQMRRTGSSSWMIRNYSGTDAIIDGVRFSATQNFACLRASEIVSGTTITSCIFDYTGSSYGGGIIQCENNITTFNNNFIYGDGSSVGLDPNAVTVANFYNNVFYDCGDDIDTTATPTWTNSGTNATNSSNSDSEISVTGIAAATDFESTSDFRPSSGGALDGDGTDGGQLPSEDVTGASFTNTNIGPFNEIVGGGGGGSHPVNPFGHPLAGPFGGPIA